VVTGGSFKHPCRHLQRSLISQLVEAAPADAMSTLAQRLIHRDNPTEPRMPPIPDFSTLGTMGVALLTCTKTRSRTVHLQIPAFPQPYSASVHHSRHGGANALDTGIN
jgi:hypothetical protein